MAIRPITNVEHNNNNYNSLSFEAKKKNKNHHDTPRSAGFMKSIPLAAIIAMSPMNSAQAQSQYQTTPKEKIVLKQEYNDNTTQDRYIINFISNDGNDGDAEKLSLSFTDANQLDYMVNRKMTKCNLVKHHEIDVDTLEVVHVTLTLNGVPVNTTTDYNVLGESSTIQEAITVVNDPEKAISKPQYHVNPNGKHKIPKNLFDYLNEVSGGQIPLKEKFISGEL